MNVISKILVVGVALCSCAFAQAKVAEKPGVFVQRWANAFNLNKAKVHKSFYEKGEHIEVLFSAGHWHHGFEAVSKSYDLDYSLIQFYDSKIKKLRVHQFEKTAVLSFEHDLKYKVLENETKWKIQIRTTMTLKQTEDGWKIVMEHSSPILGVERATKID